MSAIPSSFAGDLFQARRAVAEHDKRLEAVEQLVAGQAREVLTSLQSCLASLRQACRSSAPPPPPRPPPAPAPPAPVIVVDPGAPLPALEGLGAAELIEISRRLAADLARLDRRLAAGQLAPLAPKLVGFLDRVKERLAGDLRRLERRFIERRRVERRRVPALDPATGQPRPRGRPKGVKNRGPTPTGAARRRNAGPDGNLIRLGRPPKHKADAPHQSRPEETRAAG